MSKFKVAVMMGGKSIEREVSFNSGRTVCDHLDTGLYDVLPIYQTQLGSLYVLPWSFLYRGKTSDFESRLESEAKKIDWDDLKSLVDFVYIALHGRYAEDGTLQGMLEVLGIPYLGPGTFSCALMMNKVKQKEIMASAGLDVPRGIVIAENELKTLSLDNILKSLKNEKIKLPVIVKPCSEGSSLGIRVVFDKEELIDAIIYASSCDSRRAQDVLVEEKLEGMEFVCISLQDVFGSWTSLPVTEIVPEKGTHFFDYEQKYMPGRATKITPARCDENTTKKIQEACVLGAKVLETKTISRIDGFLTNDGRIVLLDSQPITGMSPATFIFHQAAEVGMSHTDLINNLIKVDLHNYGLKHSFPKDSKKVAMKHKIKVAVLFGGDSYEREISLESGRNICYKISPDKYEVIPIFVSDKMELYRLSQRLLVQNSTRDIAMQLTDNLKLKWSDLPKVCDFVFLGLHGGKGENGSVQGALEMLDLPYNGSSVLTSSLCMDKHKANNFLREKGFDTPKSVLVDKKDISSINIDFPLIIKPHDDGCSNLVKKINNKTELKAELKSFDKELVMVEEYIDAVELTCGVIGNDFPQTLSTSQPIVSQDILSIKEKFLPGEGENQTPANIPLKAQKLVMKTMEDVYKALGCRGYARIDCFYQPADKSPTGKERVIILEINTLPGMTPATCLFHQGAEIGLKPMQLIDKIIELGLEEHRHNAHLDKKESARLIS